MPRTMKDCDNR